jgi:hypothetical protein
MAASNQGLECGRSVNRKRGHNACSQILGNPSQHGGNAMAVYPENNYYCRKGLVTWVRCRTVSLTRTGAIRGGRYSLRMGGVAARLP